MNKIGFIGAGNMANAIISGIIGSEITQPNSIYVYDLIKEKCNTLQAKGMNVCVNEQEVAEKCDVIFFAVKPQNYIDTVEHIKNADLTGKVIVSIAAGISTQYIEQLYGKPCAIVRVMPNTPLLIGQGATALCKNANVTDKQFSDVCKIFESSGIVEVMQEKDMNSVISVNGSSPAYIYLMAKAMIDSAVSQGIPTEQASGLVYQSILGSAYMLMQSGKTPQELIDMVTSPGGTTLAALQQFEKDGFCEAIDNAMKACTKRAEELGK